MGAQESRRAAGGDDENKGTSLNYYELLGVEDNATQDEIKVNLLKRSS